LSGQYKDFKNAGAQIVAINAVQGSSEQQDFRTSHHIEFMFLTDKEASAAKSYGIFSESDPAHIVPSTFILDRRGVIRWMYIGKDPHDRPAPDVVLEELKKIK